MKLIVGLGNPGKDYEQNRHNIGFMILDMLSKYYEFEDWKSKLGGEFSAKIFSSEKIILLKPQTFMNLSGACVVKFKQYFKIGLDDIFVVYDDIDLSFGDMRFKQGGGDAGHRGVRSISHHLQSEDFNRVRFGIGRPREGRQVANFVLSNFSKDEKEKVLILAQDFCENFDKIVNNKNC